MIKAAWFRYVRSSGSSEGREEGRAAEMEAAKAAL